MKFDKKISPPITDQNDADALRPIRVRRYTGSGFPGWGPKIG